MECESGTEAAQHAPEKVPRVGVGWRGGSLVAWCLGQSGAEGPHSVLMVLALAAWRKGEGVRNGKEGGIPPHVFSKSAQATRNQWVENIPILGVRKGFVLLGMWRGAE